MGLVRIVLLSASERARDCLLMDLLQHDAAVSAVRSVSELRRALLEEVFDIVVVDTALGHGEARCLAAPITEQPTPGVIVVGDRGALSSGAWRLRQAADAWLERPFSTELLAATARNLVKRRRAFG